MRKLLAQLFACLVLWLPAIAGAQGSSRVVVDEFQISRWVTDNMQALNIPSIAVGIVGPQENYYLQAYGPAELDQPFLIGSLSKSVTAMAVLLLVEDGVLSLDDPASKWVPGVPDAVTVRLVLHQKSGLQRADGVTGWTDLDMSVEEMVASATWGPPGTYSYSNLNYNVLGRIVEEASGRRYEEFVKQRIFDPAKMTAASAAPMPPVGHVIGHQYMFGFPIDLGESEYNPAVVPSGFIWMSAEDMTRWLRLFVAQGKLDGEQVVPANVIEQLLQKPADSDYAMGWLIKSDDGVTIAKHSGATAAFTSAMSVVPEREFGVFVFTNLNLWMALGTTNVLNGVMSPILGKEPATVTNLEWVVRLLVGLLVALVLFTFLFELVRWINSKFPLKLSPRERNGVLLTIAINVAVFFAVTLYFETPIGIIITTQPDIGIAFLTMIGIGTLRRLLTGFNKTAHLRALAAADVDE